MVTERSSWSHSAKSMSRHSQGSLSVLTKVWWKHLEANGGKSQQERQSKHTHCWRVAGWSRNRWSTVLELPLDDPFQLQRTLLNWSLRCVFFANRSQLHWASEITNSLTSATSSPHLLHMLFLPLLPTIFSCPLCSLRLSSQFFDVANFGMEA